MFCAKPPFQRSFERIVQVATLPRATDSGTFAEQQRAINTLVESSAMQVVGSFDSLVNQCRFYGFFDRWSFAFSFRDDKGERGVPMDIFGISLTLLLGTTAYLGATHFPSTFGAAAPELGNEIQTHLYALERADFDFGDADESGGAIASLGNDLLIATARGRILLTCPNKSVEDLGGRVPMNAST